MLNLAEIWIRSIWSNSSLGLSVVLSSLMAPRDSSVGAEGTDRERRKLWKPPARGQLHTASHCPERKTRGDENRRIKTLDRQWKEQILLYWKGHSVGQRKIGDCAWGGDPFYPYCGSTKVNVLSEDSAKSDRYKRRPHRSPHNGRKPDQQRYKPRNGRANATSTDSTLAATCS